MQKQIEKEKLNKIKNMHVEFVIPVLNTDEMGDKFNYRGNLSNDEYLTNLTSHITTTNAIMNDFAYRYQHNMGLHKGNKSLYDKHSQRDIEYDYRFCKSLANIRNGKGMELSIDDLYNYMDSGKKFILRIIIDPLSLEDAAENELRTWIEESNMVLNDKSIDDRARLMSLPLRDFIIDTAVDGDNSKPIFQILNCKIIQLYGYNPEMQKYYFAMIVNQIYEQ